MGKKLDKAVDIWETLTSDQIDRAGHSAARVVAARKKRVADSAIAAQLTDNSQRNNPSDPDTFTVADVGSIAKFFRANRTRPALTKSETSGLIELADSPVSPSGAEAPDGLLST
ncbi:hypothetical protein AO943_34690 [Pseudomonas aeruginosa]|uniref:hypothetical protein n=1 Tax=Pseudomonas aeruginosa TaxID=287 RepID=UPI00053D183B|nr:hypothetical protein [Pseudomonas aeruginosa]KSF96325.1 hypothetical protein AO943_34690 [Pseudomonas aeruginosa]MBH4106373.1 hypothetical protein [Pseudomonas aeruginosa]MBN5041220.1 hypothetical protein [Stenotrophomonas maltophilia]HEP9943278.1 hypothetical protein [Pseudomonas aeruginosa]